MTSFWIRVLSVMVIVALLLGYNSVLEAREQEDTIARMTAELESERLVSLQLQQLENSGTESPTQLPDGIYTGEGQGYGGSIEVEVTISGGAISDIVILSAEKEDGVYLSMAEELLPRIVKQQSTDVDTISGATFSSNGILDAVEQALEEAGL